MRQMQERNENIERDVQRYRERKKIERNVGLVTLFFIFLSPCAPFQR
jgi:hypothetical protein